MANNFLRISFLGDISLNGQYIKLFKEGKNPFEFIESELNSADYVIGNLESFVKGDIGENFLKAPRLLATLDSLNFLNNISLSVACLANNHVYDHLEDGFFKTVRFLEENSIQYLGAARSEAEASKPLILEKEGVKIGLLNYVTDDTNPNIPDSAEITPSYFNIKKVKKDIKHLKPNVHHIVLSLHWGGRVEGGSFPDFEQTRIAKKLIDMGADLIVGHHSHTLQPYELYKGKYIFYSLGNFCFSDYWFDGKYYPLFKKRRLTTILDIKFSPDLYKISLQFYRNQIEQSEKINWNPLDTLNRNFAVLKRIKVFWFIYLCYQANFSSTVDFLSRDDLSFKSKIGRIYKSIKSRLSKN